MDKQVTEDPKDGVHHFLSLRVFNAEFEELRKENQQLKEENKELKERLKRYEITLFETNKKYDNIILELQVENKNLTEENQRLTEEIKVLKDDLKNATVRIRRLEEEKIREHLLYSVQECNRVFNLEINSKSPYSQYFKELRTMRDDKAHFLNTKKDSDWLLDQKIRLIIHKLTRKDSDVSWLDRTYGKGLANECVLFLQKKLISNLHPEDEDEERFDDVKGYLE